MPELRLARYGVSRSRTATWYTCGIGLLWDSNGAHYLFNGHGDMAALMSGGATLASYDYDAFGNQQNIDPADANPLRYKGTFGYYWCYK